jgi:hypothetical protein
LNIIDLLPCMLVEIRKESVKIAFYGMVLMHDLLLAWLRRQAVSPHLALSHSWLYIDAASPLPSPPTNSPKAFCHGDSDLSNGSRCDGTSAGLAGCAVLGTFAGSLPG